jgi:pimeloyl-ACP methyl ester carboxylesterase
MPSVRSWSPGGSHHVIRIDLLGHGRCAKPAGGGYAIPQQGRRVGQALDRLGVKHAIVVGHSTGGAVATDLAEQRGDQVTALALIDTGPRTDAFISQGLVGRLIEVPVVGQLLWRLRTDGLLRKGMSTAFTPSFQIPQQLVDDARGVTYHALTGIAGDRRLSAAASAPGSAHGPRQTTAGDLRRAGPEVAILIRRLVPRRCGRESRLAAGCWTLTHPRGSAADHRTSPHLQQSRAQRSVATWRSVSALPCPVGKPGCRAVSRRAPFMSLATRPGRSIP